MNANPMSAFCVQDSDDEVVMPLQNQPIALALPLNISPANAKPRAVSDSDDDDDGGDDEYQMPDQKGQSHRYSPLCSPSHALTGNSDFTMLQKKIISLNSLLEKVRCKSRFQAEQLGESEDKYSVLETELKTSQETIRHKDRLISDLQFELQRAQKGRIDNDHDSSSFLERLKAFQAKVAVTQLNNDTLQSQIVKRKASQVVVPASDPQDLKRQLAAVQEELSQTQIQLNEQDVKLVESQHRLTSCQARLMTTTEENVSYKEQVAQLHITIEELELKNADEAGLCAKMKDRLKSEKDQWARDEARLTSLVEDLQQQLQQTQLQFQQQLQLQQQQQPHRVSVDEVNVPMNARGSMCMPVNAPLVASAVASASLTSHISAHAQSQHDQARVLLTESSASDERVKLVTKGVFSKLSIADNNAPVSKKHFFALFATNADYQSYYTHVHHAAELRWGRGETDFKQYSHGTSIRTSHFGQDAIMFLKEQGDNGCLLAGMVRQEDVGRLLVLVCIDDRFILLMTKTPEEATTFSQHVTDAVALNRTMTEEDNNSNNNNNNNDKYNNNVLAALNTKSGFSDVSSLPSSPLHVDMPPPPPRSSISVAHKQSLSMTKAGEVPEREDEKDSEVVVMTMTTSVSLAPSHTPVPTFAFTKPLRAVLGKFTHNGKNFHFKEFELSPNSVIRWGDNALKYKYEEVVKSVLRGYDSHLKMDQKILKSINPDYIFSVQTTGKQLYLVAPDNNTLNSWIEALETCVQNNM